MSWISPTEKILNGVSIINTLDDNTLFYSLIDLAYSKVFGNEREKEQKLAEFQTTEMDKKEMIVSIKTLSYILSRLMVVIGTPDVIREDLIVQLKMSDEKAKVLTNYWMTKTKSLLESVVADKELLDVQWDLKVTTSSSTHQKSKFPASVLRLKTVNENNNLHLNMANEELKNLFTTLESLQNDLDLLK